MWHYRYEMAAPPLCVAAGATVWGMYSSEAAMEWQRLNMALSPSPTFIGPTAYLCARMFNATTTLKPFTIVCNGTASNVQYVTFYR